MQGALACAVSQVVRQLLLASARPSAVDDRGDGPLHLAVRGGHRGAVSQALPGSQV